MAKNKVNTMDVAASDPLDRLDSALSKFSKSGRKGSIIKAAQQNIFEFPAFVSNTIPVDYATATVSLLEQLYAAYLQVAVSINPVIDAETAKKGLQFANFKTNTNKYLEYTDTMYQHAICDPVYTEGDVRTSFELINVEDDVARVINEAMDYEPMSEFEHFWQEAPLPDNVLPMAPMPQIVEGPNGERYLAVNGEGNIIYDNKAGYVPYNQVTDALRGVQNAATCFVDDQGIAHMNLTNGRATRFPMGDADNALAYYNNFVTANRSIYNPSEVNLRNAQAAHFNANAENIRNNMSSNNAFRRGLADVGNTVSTADNIARLANDTTQAIGNIATLKDHIASERLKREKLERDAKDYDMLTSLKKTEAGAKVTGATKTEYVNDAACQKLNTMKPLLMKVGVNMVNKDDSLQPIQYIIGVKVHTRMVPASILPEVAKYPLKEMNKLSRKVKWRAGELKFFRDLVFRIKEKKQTAVDSKDPNRKWYRRLYELAHMEGDAPAAAVVQGKSIFKTFIDERRGKGKLANGMIPNASIIMSQADVDNIKSETGIDLLKGSTAKKFCGELFLISFIIIDTDAQSVKILLPDMNNDFDVHSIAAIEKQLATLSTAGSKTREIFKLLG
jgi:hypothetical protein